MESGHFPQKEGDHRYEKTGEADCKKNSSFGTENRVDRSGQKQELQHYYPRPASFGRGEFLTHNSC
jgi:hypothetical protein